MLKIDYPRDKIREKFKDLFENSLDLIYVHDLRGHFLDANDIALSSLGYSKKELLNILFKNLIDKEQLSTVFNALKEIKENGKQLKPSEYKLKKKDGNFLYVETYGIPLKRDGKIFGIFGIAKDITEHKKAEENIEAGKKKLETYINSMMDGFCINDPIGTIVQINEAFVKMFGYKSSKEIIGKKIFEYISKKEIPRLTKRFMETVKNKEFGIKNFEVICLRKDGSEFSASFNIRNLWEKEKYIGSISIARDITERKKVEQKLEESERSLRELNILLEQGLDLKTTQLIIKDNALKSSINANVIANLGGEITYVNPSFLNLLGYSSEKEVLGKLIIDFWQMKEKAAEVIKSLQETGSWIGELSVKKKDGSYCDVQLSANMILDSNNKPISMMASFLDISKRKKAEQKLKKEMEKAKKYLGIAGVAIVTLDKEGNITLLNKKGYEILQYEEGELVGKNWFETCLPKKNKEEIHEIYKKLMKGELEPAKFFENPILTKIGEERIIAWHISLLFDDSGKISGILSSGEDISKRKKAKQKLKESEKKFRLLFETSPFPIFIFEKKGKIIDCNVRSQKIFGYAKNDLIGENVIDFLWFLPKDKPFIMKKLKLLSSGKIPEPFEMQLMKRDENLIWGHIQFSFVNIGDEEVVQVMIQDITKKREAEQKLKESEEKYYDILQDLKEGYFEVDLKGNFTFINDTLTEILGYKKNKLMGKNYTNYVDEKTGKEVFKVVNNVFKSESGLQVESRFRELLKIKVQNTIEFEFIRKNREKIFVETSVYIKKDSEGNRIGFYGLVRDITEKKREEFLREKFSEKLEKEVEMRTKELNEALIQQKLYLNEIVKASQFKTEFLATMSHELRTPLNAIIGFTDLLIEEAYGPLTEDQLIFLIDIKDSAEHQFNMINHILDISKIESGQLNLNIQRFLLNNIVDQVNATLKPLYTQKGLDFKVKGLKIEKYLLADPFRVKEILLNLIENAIKFTIKGQITFIFQENKNNWIFKIKDTGIGIAEKDFDLIFKEFKRINSPYVSSVHGTGLGLSLIKRLVNLHGGDISFTSKIGVGSTFTFTIPKSIRKQAILAKDILELM
jgi:PAS domain S-box-containing protein